MSCRVDARGKESVQRGKAEFSPPLKNGLSPVLIACVTGNGGSRQRVGRDSEKSGERLNTLALVSYVPGVLRLGVCTDCGTGTRRRILRDLLLG